MVEKVYASNNILLQSMRLSISKRGVSLLMAWVLWLVYLRLTDTGAFWISLVFVPVFGVISRLAIRSQNIVLQTFAVFMFTAQAIGAPFLWMNRDNYGGSGFGSVGRFQFDLAEFFLIYLWVVAIYLLLVWCVQNWDKHIRSRHRQIEQQINNTVPRQIPRKSNKIYDALLVALIIVFLIPLSVYMGTNNIGTMGLVSDPLPYRLTGIMYYTRLYFGPLLILILLAKSSRSWGLVAVILAYAIIAGLSSASRTVLLISMFSAGYFAILDRQKVRLAIVVLIGALGFLLTSASRDYTYGSDSFSLGTAFEVAISFLANGQISVFDIIGGIANRFYGAQDMILAYQFVREDTWLAMVNYFTSGGRADTIVPDLGRDFYDMNLEGTGFGVGIGTMAYLLILGHSNILVMPFAVVILGFLISFGNQLLVHVSSKAVAAKLISHSFASGPLRVVFGGLMAFFLYSSSLNIFYTLVETFLILLLFIFLYTRLKLVVK